MALPFLLPFGPEFLRDYFQKYRYQSITSLDFIGLFREKFPKCAEQVDFDQWLYGTGGCPNVAPVDRSLVEAASSLARQWTIFFVSIKEIGVEDAADKVSETFGSTGQEFLSWDPKQKLCFLEELKANIGEGSSKKDGIVWDEGCAELLQQTYDLNNLRNAEMRFVWCRLALQAGYSKVLDNVTDFVSTQGRMKFIRPLFDDMYHLYPKGTYAQELFTKLKDGYHSIARKMIERDLATEQ